MTNGKRNATIRKLWIAIAVLAFLSPLGLIIPKLFDAGGAWGEWSLDEVRRMLGFAPAGMEKTGNAWNAPLPGYTVPGQTQEPMHEHLAYIASAIIGVALVAVLAWALTRAFRSRHNRHDEGKRGE